MIRFNFAPQFPSIKKAFPQNQKRLKRIEEVQRACCVLIGVFVTS